ncbi:4'-phosphopantetheinyl transferase family protein [Costertonia aggregata]|uniref:4'-phosphopantetheinyl transferase superfamily protein n=1 Tax=Costertonia aggregata TaxID=343403 RepID=A0A7H9AQD6_9FLAO|nr:4'-phosphopantetheinyl transferase superfamily protein [Costertonia aggregata]QLG45632.1 4'-phosphopantetheinyl transferase superfamily protein [Costertonia aggregata]
MPLYKTITVNPTVKVYIWHISESEGKLAQGITLTKHCQDRLNGMKSQLHRRGFLSIRHLMAEAGYVDHDLYYDASGKPHLKDGKHISITHSSYFTAIIVSETDEVGIDVEKQRDKILRIAHKFTPLQEYSTIANTDALVRKLTVVWGCKESLYKIYATHGLSFLHHIVISDFSLFDGETSGEIIYKGDTSKYEIKFLEFEGFTCVYALRKSK